MAGKTDKYAIISVFDKEGIVELAKTLDELGYKIISTGGTAKILSENKIPVIPVSQITKNPESFDGRMKTISFQIESGILFDRNNPKHTKEAKTLGIKPIDIVICNLYPFEKTIENPKVKLNDAIENIDIGGPTMIRAAAKNFKNVLVVVDPKDYEMVTKYYHAERSEASRDSSLAAQNDIRKELAAKAFTHLSFYDSQIGKFLNSELFPNELTISGRKIFDLRYGENPHQKSAFYLKPNTRSPLRNLQKLWGRELSYINLTDINAGLESVRLFSSPCAVVIKHNTPCGIALGTTIDQALQRAIEADPESAFGGIIVLNKPINLKAAKEIGKFKDEKKSNIDILAIPKIDKTTLEYLQKMRKTMGIYSFGQIPKESEVVNLKGIDGGFILQTADNNIDESFKNWKIVTNVKPTKKQLEQMQIAWKFISRIKSNSIIVVDKTLPMTRGIGLGQTARIRSAKIALEQAGKYTNGAILASDSFFPFDDAVKLATKFGIGAIVQQGGSINDKLSIEAANKAEIPMVLTGRRAFWH
ncbi:MAG: bifunctional phosphoribosylaminoimidazolecarboxamide formyltransferase/IMP cyclohydrolase [Candidatus Levyibacteriota bacterium]